MFVLHSTVNREIYAQAIREYAAVLSHDEMIETMTRIGVIETYIDLNHTEQWRINAGEVLASFDLDTIIAIDAAIEDGVLGAGRRQLKSDLDDIIRRRQNGG